MTLSSYEYSFVEVKTYGYLIIWEILILSHGKPRFIRRKKSDLDGTMKKDASLIMQG